MNNVTLIGRLTKDPELAFTQNGAPYVNFTVACDRPPAKDGKRETDFVQCQVWGSQAENLAKYMTKGRQIAVEGNIRVDSREENGQRRWFTKVRVLRVEYLGSAKDGSGEKEPKRTDFGQQVSLDEDLPF